jgi:phosphate:Na+ symporter
METEATAAHLERLRKAGPKADEVSSLYLDILRDLKRVNSHLVTAAAYPVLESSGDLLPSRLRQAEGDWNADQGGDEN